MSTPFHASLLRSCAHGDVEAFQALCAAEASYMFAIALCLLERPEQAEDVVHDTLLLIWQNARRHQPSQPARAWLYQVLASRLYNQLDALATTPAQVRATLTSAMPQVVLSPAAPGQPADLEISPLADAIAQDLKRHRPSAHSGSHFAALGERLPSHPLPPRLSARLRQSVAYTLPGKQALKTAEGESIYPPLYDDRLRWSMRRARLQHVVRESFKARIGRPLEERLFRRWLSQAPRSQRVEALGLPRRSVEAYAHERLDLRLDPNRLIQSISFPDKVERRKFSNQFIWKGDWDLRVSDVRTGSRYAFISDIWQHRLDPTQSDFYRRQLLRIEQGRPFRSHHKGVLLDTPERIIDYIKLYLLYMENMACFGFDERQGKDSVGVAINRHGQIVKINKGLHRLAMAQVLGVQEIPVHVRAIHHDWWRQVTDGARGEQALTRLFAALPDCRPA